MKWKTLKGKVVNIPTGRYLIDWEGDHGSRFSEEIVDWIHPYWKGDVVLAEYPVPGNTRMHFDFVNVSKRIICEHDGSQHSSYNKHLHRGSRANYLSQIKRDLFKDEVAKHNDFLMIRINPEDLPLTKEWFKTTYDITL